jgi:hypothetical protein
VSLQQAKHFGPCVRQLPGVSETLTTSTRNNTTNSNFKQHQHIYERSSAYALQSTDMRWQYAVCCNDPRQQYSNITHLALASMKARSISWLQTSTRAMHFICSGTEGQ